MRRVWVFLSALTLLALVLSIAYGVWVDRRSIEDEARDRDLRREVRNVRGEDE